MRKAAERREVVDGFEGTRAVGDLPGLPEDDGPILFSGVRQPFGWLGNMSPHTVTHGGETFRTAEAMFQCLRLPPGDPARSAIMAEKSPMSAKTVARKFASSRVVEPFSERDLENMRLVIACKLDCHWGDLWPLLESTAERTLAEDVSRRRNASGLFWGAYPDGGALIGQNWLGRIWMDLRGALL